jgi:hypothetical protein
MMNIFEEYCNELPPFKDYGELMYDKKQMKVVCRTDGTSVVHYKRIHNNLFHPAKRSDVETTEQVIELLGVATEALLRELLDEKKATYKYMSVSGSEDSMTHENYDSPGRKHFLVLLLPTMKLRACWEGSLLMFRGMAVSTRLLPAL